jgi:hypothetical protein
VIFFSRTWRKKTKKGPE